MQQQSRGIMDANADDVFIGNGVSELILFSLRALLNRGDEALVPSPDYPLWTAATHLADGKAVHYPCPPENNWLPDLDALERLVTPRTRAMVIISPNNPTGAVYPREVLAKMVDIAESHDLVVFSDEIYDQMTYDGAEYTPVATLARHTLCGTFSGLSKVYRACGFRVGWLSFSGEKDNAREYLMGLDTIASLRLCSNVVGQWAVQTALGGYQSIRDLVRPGGRLFQTRAAILDGCERSKYLSVVPPRGAMYAFLRVDTSKLPDFSDQTFALDLLERKHVLVAPGTSFNVPYRDHFRITLLPDEETMAQVFTRMEDLLDDYAAEAHTTRAANP
jgi:alanine-synthesizing transaminase